jgi:large subunit ribosomal protein L23
MSRVNPTPEQRKFDEGRLMQVLVAPSCPKRPR